MPKPDTVKGISCTVDEFFDYWFDFLRPIHKLTKKQSIVAAELVKERYKLGKVITDQNVLDTVCMNTDTRKKIRDKLGLSVSHFQVIWSKLKANKIIVDNKLNPKFIPNLESVNNDVYYTALLFRIDHGQDSKKDNNTSS